jgi:hypothetical protein
MTLFRAKLARKRLRLQAILFEKAAPTSDHMTTAIFSHPDCQLHEMGSWHPECPARLQAIEDQLISSRIGT